MRPPAGARQRTAFEPAASRRQQELPQTTSADPAESPEEDDDDSGDEANAETESTSAVLVHPLAGLSDAALRDAFRANPTTLGSISVGSPNAGRLINGVRPPESTLYELVDPEHAWGTQETVDALCHALAAVARQHPGTAPVSVGHLSARHGGPLRPHRSHQSGRDVDLGLYYSKGPARWYTRSNGENLDVARTWTLIRVLATDSDAEMILLDIHLQKRIEAHALSVGEDPDWVRLLFYGNGVRPPLVRHSPGHATHLHLRFRNPIARRSGQRLESLIAELRPPAPRPAPAISHVARSGDTLQKLARRYCTTMSAIRAANRMRGYQLKAGQRYVIPVQKQLAGKSHGCDKAR